METQLLGGDPVAAAAEAAVAAVQPGAPLPPPPLPDPAAAARLQPLELFAEPPATARILARAIAEGAPRGVVGELGGPAAPGEDEWALHSPPAAVAAGGTAGGAAGSLGEEDARAADGLFRRRQEELLPYETYLKRVVLSGSQGASTVGNSSDRDGGRGKGRGKGRGGRGAARGRAEAEAEAAALAETLMREVRGLEVTTAQCRSPEGAGKHPTEALACIALYTWITSLIYCLHDCGTVRPAGGGGNRLAAAFAAAAARRGTAAEAGRRGGDVPTGGRCAPSANVTNKRFAYKLVALTRPGQAHGAPPMLCRRAPPTPLHPRNGKHGASWTQTFNQLHPGFGYCASISRPRL